MKSAGTLVRRVWPWACLILAVTFVLGFGAVISTLLIGVSALMCWSKQFRDIAAQGKRVMGPVGRVLTASITAILALVMLPGSERPNVETLAQSAEPETARLSAGTAMDLCRQPILSQLTHSSTADFDGWDTHVQEKPGGSAMFTVGLTAKNSFGLELKLLAYCEIIDGRITSVNILERAE